MRLLILPIAASMLAALAPAAAAQDRDDYVGWVDTTFTFDRDGSVTLSQISGDVIVSTWDRDEIRIRAYAEHVPLETRFSRSRVTVGLDFDEDGRNRRGRNGDNIGDTQFEVTMPAGARLAARSVSGDVQVRDVTGQVSAASVSGDVMVTGGAEEITVTSVSGDVQLTGARGRINLNSVSGDVILRDTEGDVSANSVSGELMLQDVRARLVTAKSVSGEIDFTGPIAPDGRYELNSHSGTITLRIPADTRGTLSVSTFSGDIDSDVPVTLGASDRFGPGRSSVEIELGNGDGGRISAKTFSGDVVLRRSR